MFQTNCREKRNLYFKLSNFVFQQSCRLWHKVENYCRAGQVTDDNMALTHCMLDA